MKNFKYVGLIFLLLVTIIGCKKVKLDDDSGKLLVGKWKYQYFGRQINSNLFQVDSRPEINYMIEFYKKGKIKFISIDSVQEYRITANNQLDYPIYSQWLNRVHYQKGQNKGNFNVHYYSEDSIMISDLPYPSNSLNVNVGNMFYRVE